MINLHKSLSNLPIIIVINWAFCALFFTNSEFYRENFEFLDLVDTILVFSSLIHFVWVSKIYDNNRKNFIFTIISALTLNANYEKINTEAYYYIYFAIILMPFIAHIWSLREKK
jgi:hypothetical protein